MKFGDYTTQMESSLPRRFATAAARTTAMPTPTLNDLTVLDTTPGTVEFWDGTAWVEITRSWVGPNAPTWTPTAGDLWLDTDDVAVVPGSQLAYAEITAVVNITATTAATAQTIVSATATFDGSAVVVEFSSPQIQTPSSAASASLMINLWDGSTDLGYHGQLVTPAAFTTVVPGFVQRRIVPTAGSHTFSIRVWAPIGTGSPSVGAGPGGIGQLAPAFIRITRA
jgi:hypothetical protein